MKHQTILMLMMMVWLVPNEMWSDNKTNTLGDIDNNTNTRSDDSVNDCHQLCISQNKQQQNYKQSIQSNLFTKSNSLVYVWCILVVTPILWQGLNRVCCKQNGTPQLWLPCIYQGNKCCCCLVIPWWLQGDQVSVSHFVSNNKLYNSLSP